MSVPLPPPPPEPDKLVRQVEYVLSSELEPGEYIWLATRVYVGSVLANFVFVTITMAVLFLGLASLSGNPADSPVMFLWWCLFVPVVVLGERWFLRNRVLVLTDRRLLLLRAKQGFPFMKPGRLERQERRSNVQMVRSGHSRMSLLGPSCGLIRAHLFLLWREGIATSVAAWVFPAAEHVVR